MSEKKKICRICLGKGIKPVNIFKTILCDDLVANLLIECADVEVSPGDGCPDIVCAACLNGLEQAYSFKKLIRRSDDILKEMVDQPATLNEEYLVDKTEITAEPDEETPQLDHSSHYEDVEMAPPNTYVTLKIEPDTDHQPFEDAERLPHWMLKPMPTNDTPALNCCMCHDVFVDDVALKIHCTEVHNIDPNAEPPKKRNCKYPCRLCNQKSFPCLGQLQKHQKAFAQIVCPVCGLTFLQSKLQKHITYKHGPKKPIEHVLCETCNSYVRTTQFSVHQQTHVGELKYECDLCGKKFRVRNYLKMHLERHFSHLRPPKQKKVACAECGKKFVHQSKLLQHAVIHTNLKPHKCEYCDLTFKDYTDRRRHTWLVHTGSPYTCKSCHKPFDRPSALKKHTEVCKQAPYDIIVLTTDDQLMDQYENYLDDAPNV